MQSPVENGWGHRNASVEWRLVAFARRSARKESRRACRQLAFQAAFGLHVAMRRPRREFWLYFNAAPEDVNTAPEDVDEVCREISVGIELLGFQPLIRFA
jgi:hypothetical protein